GLATVACWSTSTVGTISPLQAEARRSSGRAALWLGIVLVLLGPALYMLQLQAKILSVPWYVLALAGAGVVLLLLAVLRRRTVWRIAALVLFGLLAGAQAYFLLSLSKVPAYTRPVVVGAAFSAFTPSFAGGS